MLRYYVITPPQHPFTIDQEKISMSAVKSYANGKFSAVEDPSKKTAIEHNFTYHAPTPEKIKRHETIRDTAKQLALLIFDETEESREQSLALTHLEEVTFWANAAIARYDR
jgi:hypothetical protein